MQAAGISYAEVTAYHTHLVSRVQSPEPQGVVVLQSKWRGKLFARQLDWCSAGAFASEKPPQLLFAP
jgi:hypothetical protein